MTVILPTRLLNPGNVTQEPVPAPELHPLEPSADHHGDNHRKHNHKHTDSFHAWALRHTHHVSRLPRPLRRPPRRPPPVAGQSWGGDEGNMDALPPPPGVCGEQALRRIETLDTNADCGDQPSDSSSGGGGGNWQLVQSRELARSADTAKQTTTASGGNSLAHSIIDNARTALQLLGGIGNAQGSAHQIGKFIDAVCAQLAETLASHRTELSLADVKEALTRTQREMRDNNALANIPSGNFHLLLPLLLLNAARPRTDRQRAIAHDRQTLLLQTVNK